MQITFPGGSFDHWPDSDRIPTAIPLAAEWAGREPNPAPPTGTHVGSTLPHFIGGVHIMIAARALVAFCAACGRANAYFSGKTLVADHETTVDDIVAQWKRQNN